MENLPQSLKNSAGKSTAFEWAVPTELEISPDPLRLRIDFHQESTIVSFFDGGKVENKMVDAMDIAHALASELTFTTGMLPEGCLWWSNNRHGQTFAIYTRPQIRKLALQLKINELPRRFIVPMPGLIFLCSPAKPPRVYAVGKKPTKETTVIYKAPLTNLGINGQSCGGSHKYPERIADIIPSFFESFFTSEMAGGKSKKYNNNVIQMWEELDGKEGSYPISDLIKHGTLADLMKID